MSIPHIRGLVLAGGKSRRMGEDKGKIIYHQKPQRIHCYELMQSLGLTSVHISCRQDQVEELKDWHPISDPPGKAGPIFILRNVLTNYPNSACLLLPCDVPLMDKVNLLHLIHHRDPSKIATAFRSPIDAKPEPLLAIWEPSALTLIIKSIENGILSPRKLLMDNDPILIDPQNPQALLNVNSPAEREDIKKILGK